MRLKRGGLVDGTNRGGFGSGTAKQKELERSKERRLPAIKPFRESIDSSIEASRRGLDAGWPTLP